jgi:hydroxymethylbilane synthase
MAQATAARERLLAAGVAEEVEIVKVVTSGDKGDRDRLGAFVREIQESLLRNEVDIALHCLKDLPTEPVEGLRFSAYLKREDARDTLITRVSDEGLGSLKLGATVGTGSVRRTSQLAAQRRDLHFKPLLGNVDTRLRKLRDGEYDAIVLAIAGLIRLGLLERGAVLEFPELAVHPLTTEQMMPAAGQAVLVLETRTDDGFAHAASRTMHHAPTEVCAVTERRFLRAFGGGCSVPVAAYAIAGKETVTLSGVVASPDGATVIRERREGPLAEAEALADALVEAMNAQGAFKLFERK